VSCCCHGIRFCRISSRSIASTVVPTGNLKWSKGSLALRLRLAKLVRQTASRDQVFSHMIVERSSTLRSSRTFPGHVWLIKMSATSVPMPRTLLPCFRVHVPQNVFHQQRNIVLVIAKRGK